MSRRRAVAAVLVLVSILAFDTSVRGERHERIGPDITVASPVGEDFLGKPDVASHPDGSFVVTWENERAYSGGIWGRAFTPDGSARGAAFQVGTSSGYAYPRVATDAAGGFVVVWTKSGIFPSFRDQVRARRYDTLGPRGGDFMVNEGPSTASGAFVAAAPTGDFAVVWAETENTFFLPPPPPPGFPPFPPIPSTTKRFLARRYDPSGTAPGPAFQMAGSGYGGSSEYSSLAGIGMAADRTFVVAWSTSYYGQKVNAQKFSANDNPLGTTSLPGTNGVLAVDPTGGFTLGYTPTGTQGVEGRHFDSAVSSGASFPVATSVATGPVAAADAAGNVAFLWNSGSDLRARRFSPAGVPKGPEFVVASGITTTSYGFIQKGLSSDPVGNLVVVWRNGSIYARQVLQCGNGDIDAGEQCDDGNVASGDCCSAKCAIEPPSGSACVCGNGIVDPGEVCDDGNAADGDCCAADCRRIMPQGSLCRGTTGYCDLAEVCDGTSATCPSNAFRDDGTPCVSQDQCIERTQCQEGQCSGIQVCSATAIQREHKGKPKPFVIVNCSASTDGGTEAGSCEAEVIPRGAALATVKRGRRSCRKDPNAITKCRKRKLANGQTTLLLRLNRKGRQLLKASPNGEVPADTVVFIRRPQGTSARQIVPTTILRRR